MLTCLRGGPLVASFLWLATIPFAAQPAAFGAEPTPVPNHVLRRALDIHMGRIPRPARRKRVSSGPLYAALQASRALSARDMGANEPGVAPVPATRPRQAHPGMPERLYVPTARDRMDASP